MTTHDPLDQLDGLAALARKDVAPAVPFAPTLTLVLQRQRREARMQAWFLGVASAAAVVMLAACLPTLISGPDPLEAVFQVAYGGLP